MQILVKKMTEKNEIATRRKLLGLTQKQLAELSGIPQTRLCEYEKGRYPIENMTIATAKKLAKALNCNIDDLA